MERTQDAKLELLAASPCRNLSRGQLRTVGRLCELLTVRAGTQIRSADGHDTWSYHVVAGTVLVEDGERLSALGPGSWIIGQPLTDPVTATASTDVTLLGFGLRELHSVRQLLAP